MNKIRFTLICSFLLLLYSCSRSKSVHLAFVEHQLLCTADSNLYVRISSIDLENEHIWKLDIGDFENEQFEPWDTFYGSCEWQGASEACYWWTFAETHICEAIFLREDSCIMYFPAAYDCFYPQLKPLLIDNGVKLYPIK